MASWKKLLAAMAEDQKPVSYTYDNAASVLGHLGFALASGSGTSHRTWRLKQPGKDPVKITLVDRGSGPMRKAYIVDMIHALRENNLLPEGVE